MNLKSIFHLIRFILEFIINVPKTLASKVLNLIKKGSSVSMNVIELDNKSLYI